MALDTVLLSDIGQSLVAIENEIIANQAQIQYYQAQAKALAIKNETLQAVAKSLLMNAIPKTMDY
jgi:hypothetical protein